MATSYFTFELDDGTRTGLVRQIEDDAGLTLERIDPAGDWVEDPALIRHFADPGDSQLVKIDKEEAQPLATAYGTEL